MYAGRRRDRLTQARQAVERAGGFDAELADIESVAAHRANRCRPPVARQMGRDRATMFSFVLTGELEATSSVYRRSITICDIVIASARLSPPHGTAGARSTSWKPKANRSRQSCNGSSRRRSTRTSTRSASSTSTPTAVARSES
jgi:hypothetical protein